MITRRLTIGRLTIGLHAYTDEHMSTLRRRLIIQPYLFWWL